MGAQQGPLELVWSEGARAKSRMASGACCPSPCRSALVLVLGSAMASAKACKKALAAIATLANDKKSAILVTTFVSTICCWLNWGFGLIAGALLAKAVAHRVPGCGLSPAQPSAYCGLVIWHAGL